MPALDKKSIVQQLVVLRISPKTKAAKTKTPAAAWPQGFVKLRDLSRGSKGRQR